MTPLLLAITVPAVVFLTCCTAILLRYRGGRLAAEALHGHDRVRSNQAFVLPFAAPPKHALARVSSLSLSEAEDLLDWLEQHGYEERGLLCDADAVFAVEFRVDEMPPVEAQRSTA